MTDTFNVTATLDKTSYNTGQTMTLTITGGDVLTQTTTTQQALSGTVNLVAADGATSTIAIPSGVTVNVTSTTTTPESVKISSVTDTQGRTWTVAASGLTATATA